MEEYAAIVERRSCTKCAMSWTKDRKIVLPEDELKIDKIINDYLKLNNSQSIKQE